MTVFSCYIRWDVSPEIFSVGQLSVRYYGLLMVVAFLTASFVFYRILKHEGESLFLLPVTANAVFLGTLIGARLGECLFYFPEYYLKNPLEIIFPFRNGEYTGIGGLSSHGAAFAILAFLFFTAKNIKKPAFWLIDRVCVTIPPAAFFIRLGNLMNSEILGTETSVPWGFIFERRGEDFPRHPVQLYEAFCYLIVFFVIWKFYRTKRHKVRQGTVSGLFLILIFFPRFILEIFKAPISEFDSYSFFSTGQYLSLFFVFAGIALLTFLSMEKRES
ncbi:MAG: prolipoprotein diacylglyceryl transferase [Prevotellaceae bacterium]|jgi:prolipoprotein diacylglyceryl transferase|nr:prolipoprotein diacylglyceryl transferase [Prevotellaceae bacterium]